MFTDVRCCVFPAMENFAHFVLLQLMSCNRWSPLLLDRRLCPCFIPIYLNPNNALFFSFVYAFVDFPFDILFFCFWGRQSSILFLGKKQTTDCLEKRVEVFFFFFRLILLGVSYESLHDVYFIALLFLAF